jgi:tetratricopeptide (TPR) repeat protein
MMHRSPHERVTWLLFGSLLIACLGPSLAGAQERTDAETRALAGQHFDRGIAFYNEHRYDAALAELARAYELAPAHQTLYNLARVHAALGHAVEATRAYEHYLRDAGDRLPPRRRAEAERALEEQRARIGQLMVRVDVAGATIAIDGVDVATTPLAIAIPLSAGAHTVEVRAPGHETSRRAVAIAGQSETLLELELREEVVPRGNLRVTTSVPEVRISVDDESVGLTPLSSTLPLRAGTHRVTAERVGYVRESRTVEIDEGADAELSIEMRRDPSPPAAAVGRVRLELPDAPYRIVVDGEPMMGQVLDLPIGGHDITLEVTDRQPYQGTVRVPPGSVLVIVPPLAWTLDARRARIDEAEGQRNLGWVLAVAGGAFALGGASVLIWNEAEIAGTDGRLVQINDDLAVCEPMGVDVRCDMLRAEGERLVEEQAVQNAIRGVSIASTVLGLGVGAVGLGIALGTPSSDEVDAAARARASLRLGPGGVSVVGAF